MNPEKLSNALSVSSQLVVDDLSEFSTLGFRSIICNRPDSEAKDQPKFAEIENAANLLDIQTRNIPIQIGRFDIDHVNAFSRAMNELPNPVLAYCQDGLRSATVWSLTQAGTMSVGEIVTICREAGYDIAPVVSLIANGLDIPFDDVRQPCRK